MYKITFKLLSPICFVDRPIFDGIIAYAYAKENLKEKFYQKLNIDDIIDFVLLTFNFKASFIATLSSLVNFLSL